MKFRRVNLDDLAAMVHGGGISWKTAEQLSMDITLTGNAYIEQVGNTYRRVDPEEALDRVRQEPVDPA